MKLVGRIASALILCACGTGCKKSEQKHGPMPQPSKAAPAGFDVDTAKAVAVTAQDTAPTTTALVKAGTSSLTPPVLPAELVLLLKTSLPAIEDARVLEDLQAIPQSRMARLVVCLEHSVERSTSQVLRAYRKASWKEITVHTPPHDENRRSFSAVSDDFRLSGSAYQGAFKDCAKDKDFTRISFSFHERKDASATPPTPALEGAVEKRPATLVSPRTRMRDTRTRDAQ